MHRITDGLALAAAMAAGTWVVGWWTVPLLAAGYGAWRGMRHGAPIVAALAALVAWGGLLTFVAARGPLGSLAQLLGQLLRVGEGAVVGLTLAFPALLALTAAMVGRTLSRPRGA